MIRNIKLICSECQQNFIAENIIYYKDNFINKDLQHADFICQNCYNFWSDHWQIASATFYELDNILYVDFTLDGGEVYKRIDCTAIDDCIVTGLDLPKCSQKKLFTIYSKWLEEIRKDLLKECTFFEDFMKTTFTCRTYGGENYEDIAFRINRKNKMETAVEIPENILQQVIIAWHQYELQHDNESRC